MLSRMFICAALGLIAGAGPFSALAQRNLTATTPQPQTEQRVALVIGNSAYKEAPLRNPVNDANDVARTLRDLGWKVVLRTNASQRQMKEAIREFGGELTKGSVGLFYFAGHGIQYRGENFLVPVAANIEREAHVEDETVSANFVLRQMEEARNRTNIVILDACRNNPFERGFRSASRGLAQMDAAQGALIAFATAPGSVAADGVGRNGVYTKHLLQQLRTPGVPAELMFKRVRDGVMRDTKEMQVPWESSSLRGADFYLRPSQDGTQVAAVQSAPAPDLGALELALWNSVKDAKSAEEVKAYLNKYPDGEFSELARIRIKGLEGPPPTQISSIAPQQGGAAIETFLRGTLGKWSSDGCKADTNVFAYWRAGNEIAGEYISKGKRVFTYRIDLASVKHMGTFGGMERFSYLIERTHMGETSRNVYKHAYIADIEPTRRRIIENLQDGVANVRDGRVVSTGAALPFIHKCEN
jgi:uncharacterized caspase-like protein